jgi:hypothetical protein
VFDQRAARCTKMPGETIGMLLNGLSTSKSVLLVTIKIGVTIHHQFQEFIVRRITTRHDPLDDRYWLRRLEHLRQPIVCR